MFDRQGTANVPTKQRDEQLQLRMKKQDVGRVIGSYKQVLSSGARLLEVENSLRGTGQSFATSVGGKQAV